ncbi:hypothetical protein EAI_12261 [Harpegnathos saltator]|uniref:Odorant receptor n=1 Tax=Harpegnathos saltator TaxID=610380 RepID=E2BC78_HARSA|nr:hypothetical protein EAI_12261 [Harpegnathos saltator]
MTAARSKSPATGAIEQLVVDRLKSGTTADEEAGNFDYAVAINRWSMRLLGMWPLDTSRLSHLRCGLSFGTMLVINCPAIVYLFMITNWVAIMNQANLTFPLFFAYVKFVLMKTKAKNLRLILRSMSRDWANYRYLSARDRRAMFHYAKKGRQINVFCFVWMMLAVGVYIITPLVESAWLSGQLANATSSRLPTDVFFSLEQPYAYEMMYVGQSIIGLISGTVIFSVDCFICIVVFHACGQLDVLAATLERYDGTVEHDGTKDACFRSCACLPCIVKRHVHILKYG